ncbi:hypothetical protein GCM10012286_37990 [Streptomyces lasiicapitis]|uniref:Uncharacterized protein n=1 Tax=Streptomyces lasiicapitis TaxID=1923961 RepID=A0ABQ2M427_9ACTN|nr:hypothetical protein GCM10012286_37990 [Streptomyces lasiicapitis]
MDGVVTGAAAPHARGRREVAGAALVEPPERIRPRPIADYPAAVVGNAVECEMVRPPDIFKAAGTRSNETGAQGK